MSKFLALGQGMIDSITGLIGQIFYLVIYPVFTVLDSIQSIFYAFAGIAPIRVNNELVNPAPSDPTNVADNENGIVYYMLRSKALQNIFISMLILAVFLLVIFTIMAFIKNVYSAKQKKWQDIISSTIKGAVNFVVIPVACLLGAIAGNFLLQALDDATATATDTTISHQIFVASAFDANKFRMGNWDESDVASLQTDYANFLQYLRDKGELNSTGDLGQTIQTGRDGEYYAQFVDAMYKNSSYKSLGYAGIRSYYDSSSLNYFLLIVSCVFLLFALIKIAFGMVKRLFMLMLLYVISPIMCSMYPLDDGSTVKSWRGKFTENFFSAYGAVVGMNIFYLLVPLLSNIKLAGSAGSGLNWMGIIPIVITICALYMVTDFITMAGSFLSGVTGGAANALEVGSGLAGKVKGRLKQGTAKVGAGGKRVVGAFTRGVGAGVERRREINEQASKDLGLSTRDDFATRAEWRAYKKTKEYQANKDELKQKRKDAAKTFGGGGLKAFGSSMGSSAGHGALNILGSVVDSVGTGLGFGKTTNLMKDFKDNKGQGADRAKRQKATSELLRDLTPETDAKGNVTKNVDFAKAGKAFSGKNGEQLYDAVKDTPAFKKLMTNLGISEKFSGASEAGSFFTNMAKQQKAQNRLESIQLSQSGWNQAINGLVTDENINTTGWDKSTIEAVLINGQKLDETKYDAKDTAMVKAINKLMENGITLRDHNGDVVKDKSGNEQKIKYNDAFSQGKINIATQNAYETAQSVRSELKDDSAMAQQMDSFLADMKETITRIDNGEEIKEVNANLTQLRAAEQEYFKQLSEDFVNVVKSSSKDIKKEIVKNNKPKS